MILNEWEKERGCCGNSLCHIQDFKNQLFTIVFSPLPALKAGAFVAGIRISSFVLGLRPLRAAR